MRTAAIILGIIAASFLLPQSAFARGGKDARDKSGSDRRKSRVEVVTEPVIVERGRRSRVARKRVVVKPAVVAKARPEVVVVRRAAQRQPQHARHEVQTVRHGRRRHAAPPVQYRSRPAVHQHRHNECCGFIPGHFEKVARQVVVPGYNKKVYVAPVYIERCTPRGVKVKIMVRPAGWRHVWVPATTLTRYEQVWVDGVYHCGR